VPIIVVEFSSPGRNSLSKVIPGEKKLVKITLDKLLRPGLENSTTMIGTILMLKNSVMSLDLYYINMVNKHLLEYLLKLVREF
jgi:hypothetical protein